MSCEFIRAISPRLVALRALVQPLGQDHHRHGSNDHENRRCDHQKLDADHSRNLPSKPWLLGRVPSALRALFKPQGHDHGRHGHNGHKDRRCNCKKFKTNHSRSLPRKELRATCKPTLTVAQASAIPINAPTLIGNGESP